MGGHLPSYGLPAKNEFTFLSDQKETRIIMFHMWKLHEIQSSFSINKILHLCNTCDYFQNTKTVE